MKICVTLKKILFTLVLITGEMKDISFLFDLLIDYFCFYEIFACVHVSFRMISFRAGVYMTFITRFHFCQYDNNEITASMSFGGISYIQL